MMSNSLIIEGNQRNAFLYNDLIHILINIYQYFFIFIKKETTIRIFLGVFLPPNARTKTRF